MKQPFINIATVFKNDEDRSVQNLSSKYFEKDFLFDCISNLSMNILIPEKISKKKILLKPNWVRHSKNVSDEICLRTHDSFLLVALEVILGLKPACVTIGDAPIQGCKWGKMLDRTFLKQVDNLSSLYDIPVYIKDFRKIIFDSARNKITQRSVSDTDYMIFNLGKKSFMEDISTSESNLFRVTNYNPIRLAESHKLGVHKYCITKEIFDADIIISIPKVKTHQKVGLTCALKNIVGLNGDKDYLPHHRLGGTERGGDCYPGKNTLRYFSELCMDNANRNQGTTRYRYWQKLSSLFWSLSFPKKIHQKAAGWYGNDTTWRMVLDLNTIVSYGTSNGEFSSKKQREMYSLCDGIIGGQGDGPLTPKPLPLGIVSFSNDSFLTDLCMATLMRFDYRKLPILLAKEKRSNIKNAKILLNRDPVTIDELKKKSIKTTPPPGWKNYLE